MRESEYITLLSMVDEINKQIKKMKKIARKDNIWMMRMTTISHKFPYHPCRKKANKHPAPSSDSNDSCSCKKAVEGPSMGKGGGKKPKLAKKRKQKDGERK